MREILHAKEEECHLLETEVRNIENRWKSGAREPHKVTTKGVMAALQLKSMNELSSHKLRCANSYNYLQPHTVNAGTITRICGLDPEYKYPGLERVPLHHKETQIEPIEMKDKAVGNFDYRSKDVHCQINKSDIVDRET